MKTHEFEIDCIPPKTTAQATTRIFRNRATGKMFIGKNDKGRDVREGLMSLFAEHRPDEMFTTPVKLEVEWVYPYLKTIRKRDIGKKIPCTTRPDSDNICKFVQDIMTRLAFWTDDSLVWDLRFKKYYAPTPCIKVKISEYVEEL